MFIHTFCITVLQLFLQCQFYRTVNLQSLSRSKADVQYWLALTTKRADLVGIASTYRWLLPLQQQLLFMQHTQKRHTKKRESSSTYFPFYPVVLQLHRKGVKINNTKKGTIIESCFFSTMRPERLQISQGRQGQRTVTSFQFFPSWFLAQVSVIYNSNLAQHTLLPVPPKHPPFRSTAYLIKQVFHNIPRINNKALNKWKLSMQQFRQKSRVRTTINQFCGVLRLLML